MPRDGTKTREKILEVAYELILQQGYAATSVDQILERAGITKGAFFYHFKSKADMARALIHRHDEHDQQVLNESMGRAEKLSRDPLQQLLIATGLLEELFAGLEDTNPGCLFASFCYESDLMDDEIAGVCSNAMLRWRTRLRDKLEEVAREHPPRIPVDMDSLADLLTTIFEGGFVLARTLNNGGLIAGQIRHYRNYLELLFSDTPA